MLKVDEVMTIPPYMPKHIPVGKKKQVEEKETVSFKDVLHQAMLNSKK